MRYQAPRTATGTNQYGTEVAVVNGVVTGHGESGTWLRTYATVGTRITLS